MKWLALCLAMCPAALGAQDATKLASEALEQLNAASEQLTQAEDADDRIAALTQTVKAFETGLGALREGMRQVDIRQGQLQRRLNGRDAELGALLGALLRIQPTGNPQAFLHPQGPTGAVRAGMLLSEVSPVLNAEAQQLRMDLLDMQNTALIQQKATRTLETGLVEVQIARRALHTAAADRTDLPFRFISDPVRVGLLIASSETLDAFASGLSTFVQDDLGWTPPDLEARIGSLSLPATGTILRYPGEADAAGIARPGIVLATRPGTLVTSPFPATLRYSGPLLDMGMVVILEPRADVLLVLSGLGVSFGQPGQVLPEGAPLGTMNAQKPELNENERSTGGEKGGAGRSETLYIEVRQNNVPQDPTMWFLTDKDG